MNFELMFRPLVFFAFSSQNYSNAHCVTFPKEIVHRRIVRSHVSNKIEKEKRSILKFSIRNDFVKLIQNKTRALCENRNYNFRKGNEIKLKILESSMILASRPNYREGVR